MLDRRNALKTLAAAPIFGSLAALQSWGNEYQAKENRRPRVAAIYTSFTYVTKEGMWGKKRVGSSMGRQIDIL